MPVIVHRSSDLDLCLIYDLTFVWRKDGIILTDGYGLCTVMSRLSTPRRFPFPSDYNVLKPRPGSKQQREWFKCDCGDEQIYRLKQRDGIYEPDCTIESIMVQYNHEIDEQVYAQIIESMNAPELSELYKKNKQVEQPSWEFLLYQQWSAILRDESGNLIKEKYEPFFLLGPYVSLASDDFPPLPPLPPIDWERKNVIMPKIWLARDLQKATIGYLLNHSKEGYEEFSKICNEALSRAKPKLLAISGFPSIFENIELALNLARYKLPDYGKKHLLDGRQPAPYNNDDQIFLQNLNFFRNKMETLHKAADDCSVNESVQLDYQKAYGVAKELLHEVDVYFYAYTLDKTPSGLNALKESCKHAIERARPVLQQHRGYKGFFGHLTLFLLTGGLVHLGAGLYRCFAGKSISFFKTDSENKLNDLGKTIEQFQPYCPSSFLVEPNASR